MEDTRPWVFNTGTCRPAGPGAPIIFMTGVAQAFQPMPALTFACGYILQEFQYIKNYHLFV
jgi:hypothetical protein